MTHTQDKGLIEKTLQYMDTNVRGYPVDFWSSEISRMTLLCTQVKDQDMMYYFAVSQSRCMIRFQADAYTCDRGSQLIVRVAVVFPSSSKRTTRRYTYYHIGTLSRHSANSFWTAH
jgi:hypothetical protein